MSEPEEMDAYVFPVRCVCGWRGMSDDVRRMECPWCGLRTKRERREREKEMDHEKAEAVAG